MNIYDKLWIWCFLSSIILLIRGNEEISILMLISSTLYFALSVLEK